jgi:hypothetical protein
MIVRSLGYWGGKRAHSMQQTWDKRPNGTAKGITGIGSLVSIERKDDASRCITLAVR